MHWDRWFFVVAQGLTFLETGNSNLLDNAIAMRKERISLSIAPQLLSKFAKTFGREAHTCMKEIEAGLFRTQEAPFELPKARIVEEAVGSRDGLLRTRTIIHPPSCVSSEEEKVAFMLSEAEIFLSLKLRLESNVISQEDPCMIVGLAE